jgi:phosphoribosyl-ATP pyrophosphohydrolase
MTATLDKNPICQRRRHKVAGELAPELRELGTTGARTERFALAQPLERLRGASVDRSHEIELLYTALGNVTADRHPRTARLLASSRRKVAQKVIEEAGEVALAAVKHNRRNIVRESADLLYQLAVLWHREGVPPREVWAEMRRRVDMLGIAEKLPKSRVHKG